MTERATPASPFLERLSAQQTKALRRLDRLLRKPGKQLPDYYDIGKALQRLRPAKAKYGQRWTRELLKYFRPDKVPCSRTLFYRTLGLVRLYKTRKELSALEGLDWQRVMLLLPVRDVKARRVLVRQALKQGWSFRTMRLRVFDRVGYGHARGARRPHLFEIGREFDWPVLLRDLERQTQLWLDHNRALWSSHDGLVDKLRRRPRKDWTPEVRNQIEAAVEALRELAAAVEDLAEALAPRPRRPKGHDR